jgi:hypothetical protein
VVVVVGGCGRSVCERERRQAADRRRFEQQQAVEQADAGVELPPIAPMNGPFAFAQSPLMPTPAATT